MSPATAGQLERIRVEDAPYPAASWAKGQTVYLPHVLTSMLHDKGAINDNTLICPLHPEGDINPASLQQFRLQYAFTDRKPLSSRLPFSYQRVPSVLRSLIARLAVKARDRTQETFPAWPLDLSTDFLADLFALPSIRFSGEPAPVILTHDLDSPEGLTSAVSNFLSLEEDVGARSASYIVPCGWKIDPGLVAELVAREHELGIHGYDHSNKTAFCSADERRRRLDIGAGRLRSLGVRGYRSPSLLRTRVLLNDLADYYDYDSSIPTSGGKLPVPGTGCGSARPFRIGRLVEIPLSLPRDGSLLFLGYSPMDILDMWKRCSKLIADSGGVVVLLTHCEERFSGNPAMLEIYREFLAYIEQEPGFRWSSTQEIVDRCNSDS